MNVARRRRPRAPLTPAEYVALRRLQALAAAVEQEIGRRLAPLGLDPPPPSPPPAWTYKLDDAAWDAGFGELTNDMPPADLARDVVALALDLDSK
jgi:hypothetical protein